MKPFFFGRSDGPLFGVYHPLGSRTARPAGAVLLCNPFGQEAIRAHKIYAVLAQRLTRAGYVVLRFDYTGTGDSSGDIGEGGQARWLDDVLEAHDELATTSGVARVTWVGLRYGATLAVMASEKVDRSLASLVLWDPIVDGAAYLTELAESHVAFMKEDVRGWQPASPPGSESLGFPLGADLRRALAAVDLTAPRRPRAAHVSVIASRPTPELDRLREALPGWGAPSRWLSVASSSPWNSEEAMNSALIPTDLLEVVVGRVQNPEG